MDNQTALDRLAEHATHPLSTHELAQVLLALPDTPMKRTGVNETWSSDLDGDSVQVAIRTY